MHLVVDLVGDNVDISMSSILLLFSFFSLMDSGIVDICSFINDVGVSEGMSE